MKNDGSTDIYFATKGPNCGKNNWLETVPRKIWFVILQMYGPLKFWLEQTWRPGEIELMNQSDAENVILNPSTNKGEMK